MSRLFAFSRKFAAFLLLLAVIEACSLSLSSVDAKVVSECGLSRQVWGNDDKEGMFPYIVSIKLKKEKLPLCAGTIVHKDKIVTAASCL